MGGAGDRCLLHEVGLDFGALCNPERSRVSAGILTVSRKQAGRKCHVFIILSEHVVSQEAPPRAERCLHLFVSLKLAL